MPAYDYRCDSCGNVFEKTQRITEPAGAECPKCAGAQCTRLITGGTFHLKGSGWYASDYGAKKAGPNEPEKKMDTASGAGSSEAKTPAAPAAEKPVAAPTPPEPR